MRLTKKARKAIDKQPTRLLLALALGCSVDTIKRYIKDVNNDDLTKAAAMKVIREETGLKDDQILESIPARESAKVIA
jgi:hypothetical protein